MKNYNNILKNKLGLKNFKRIHYKITLLIWSILIFSMLIFLLVLIPFQRSASLDRMNNEAKDIASSISFITATAIISEDYSFAVDHCRNVVTQSSSLEYIIITKNDGFSLIITKENWNVDTLSNEWIFDESNQSKNYIEKNKFSNNNDIYNYSSSFSYSGINWGSIHIGLSLNRFYNDNKETTQRSLITALICILLGFFLSYYFTKRLISPINILTHATNEVANGNLNSRATINTNDELHSLGNSFNLMTESLQKSRNELIANNDFINNIIKSLNDSLIVLNTSWQITKANPFTTELTSFHEEELLGKSIDLLLDEVSLIKFNDKYKSLQIDDLIHYDYNDELYFKTKFDFTIPVIFSISPILENETNLVGYVAVARDISARKQAELALRKANDELENRVNLRTKELLETNTKLLSEISTRIDAEERISSSLKEKEVLLREIHHRVKNNLQVISSLLFLQSRKIEIKEYKEIFNESQNRIKSMALVHENLYKSDNLAGIELQDYMKALLNHLLRTYNISTNKIKHEISIENIILSIDKSIPLGLIMNELITNSLKYAFPDSDEGMIVISIKRLESGNIYVSFSDNGIGMPVNYDIKKSNSLGLKLVETLVDQLEGTFKWVNNNGTEFIIEFSEVLKARY